jgi:hypothetical protein
VQAVVDVKFRDVDWPIPIVHVTSGDREPPTGNLIQVGASLVYASPPTLSRALSPPTMFAIRRSAAPMRQLLRQQRRFESHAAHDHHHAGPVNEGFGVSFSLAAIRTVTIAIGTVSISYDSCL